MVRTDHEDGGILNPSGDGEKKADDKKADDKKAGEKTASVERSSPLARRRKSGRRESVNTDEAARVDETARVDEAVTAEEIVGASATADETDVADSAPSEDDTAVVSADDRARGISYRDRRPSVKAPVGSGRSSSKTMLIAVGTALGAIVLVAAIVVSIVFTVASSRIDDKRELRADYDQFAQEVVVKLTTLNKDNADSMLDFMNKHTSGRALQQMRESMKQATDLIRQDNMKTKTTVVASAVENADEDDGSVLVVFAWESTAPEAPDKPVIETFRSRIDITRINGDLKLTNYEWVG
ncbi:hypothetical protein [Gordonia sp. (in: high G+C Gram-positive bacteria)]|uniref:hypothetical protein n=1 Tax=Gordonia sp. (in: high G+C Gram-positive bacteria) TaxID=84139 RepID=UPI003F9BC764